MISCPICTYKYHQISMEQLAFSLPKQWWCWCWVPLPTVGHSDRWVGCSNHLMSLWCQMTHNLNSNSATKENSSPSSKPWSQHHSADWCWHQALFGSDHLHRWFLMRFQWTWILCLSVDLCRLWALLLAGVICVRKLCWELPSAANSSRLEVASVRTSSSAFSRGWLCKRVFNG